MTTVLEGRAAPDLSTIHRLFQQVFSLVLSRFQADDPLVVPIVSRLHDCLSSTLATIGPVTLRRGPDGFYLNDVPLQDSFVLKRLFEAGRCSAVTFREGLGLAELRKFVAEVAHGLQRGRLPSSAPVGDAHGPYGWIQAA
jgi:hypothetical protein